MLTGISREVQETVKPVDNVQDDIFISCASFEKRCRGVVEKFDIKYRALDSFVFRYDAESMTNLRDINFGKMVDIVQRHSGKTSPVICNHHDPLDGVFKFQELLKNSQTELSGKIVTLDVTTFTKQYILVLLKFLENQRPRLVRIFYTEPLDYAAKWKKPLSYGLIEVVSVPSYGGHTYIEKENMLVLLLGYEGDRAYSIWEKLSPHQTIILIGKPSYRDSWEGRVESFNRKLIDKLPKEAVKYVSTLDPFSVCQNLDSLFNEYQSDFNIALSPLGPKPQVIGSYLSLRNHSDVQVLYAIPKYYEEKYFSKEIGRIWEYR
jgi:hypothetical protein